MGTAIRVMSSAATKAAYLELVPQFELASGHKVFTEWVPSVQMMTRLDAKEPVDLVIMAARSIEELITAGKVRPGSRMDLARSGVGVAIRAGAPRTDIATADAFKRMLLAAKGIAYSTGPSGLYLIGLFERLGVADDIRTKCRQVQGEPVGAVVARGEAEIGFQQVSELLPVEGIDYLGPLPAEIQQITSFAAGLPVRAREIDAANALIRFLCSPAAAAAFRKSGMEPA
jgi:molybdate transport system substrate-binding protein